MAPEVWLNVKEKFNTEKKVKTKKRSQCGKEERIKLARDIE